MIVSNIGDNKKGIVKRMKKIDLDSGKYEKVNVDCPSNIINYIKNSRGVDKFDQVISYYSVDHRSVKWYIRIIIHLLSLVLHNSFILYSLTLGQKSKVKTYLEFEKSVIRSLIGEMRLRKNISPTPLKKKPTLFDKSVEKNSGVRDCQLIYDSKTYCSICQGNGMKKKKLYV